MFSSGAPAPPVLHTRSLHDALPICRAPLTLRGHPLPDMGFSACLQLLPTECIISSKSRHRSTQMPTTTDVTKTLKDRKSTRLNSSHLGISYAVFCLKKKKKSTTHQS